MTESAEHYEAALEEDARQRAQAIQASEEAAAAAEDQAPSTDAEIAQVHRSGRQHDYSDTVAHQRPRAARRAGPRR